MNPNPRYLLKIKDDLGDPLRRGFSLEPSDSFVIAEVDMSFLIGSSQVTARDYAPWPACTTNSKQINGNSILIWCKWSQPCISKSLLYDTTNKALSFN